MQEFKFQYLDRKLKVGAVSYLNTKPLIYELERGSMSADLELVIDHPARLAAMLLNDEIDIGLVPVAIIPEMDEYHLVSDYCIGTNGEVASVCLFSDVPLEEIKVVLLDYQSRTSSALLNILIREHWKLDVVIKPTTHQYQDNIKGTTAGLVIGDRAFVQRGISRYIYDLGLAWKEYSGLPFVFATWLSKHSIDKGFISAFNAANASGLKSIPGIVEQQQYTLYDLSEYYNVNLSYTLNEEKMKGLTRFLSLLSLHSPAPTVS